MYKQWLTEAAEQGSVLAGPDRLTCVDQVWE
jgi:hypothetical protein